MAHTTTIDVLIVGAGPTGLALAYQLRRLGISFRIIEQQRMPSTTSKAIGLQYRVSEVLTWMGLFERFQAHSVTGTAINFFADGQHLLQLRLDQLEGMSGQGAFKPQSMVIPQSVTERLLIDALDERGVPIEYNTTFVSSTQDHTRVVSHVQHNTHGHVQEAQIESRYLVSCEGAHSRIRKQAGISFAGKAYPVTYYMADVELDWQHSRDEVCVWMHADGMFSAIPMPGERRWRLFVESSQQESAAPTEVTLDLIRQMMAKRIGDSTTQIGNASWLTEFRISCRMVDRFRERRVFLAGDAAHIHSPTGGQGITTGIQDIYNLAWKLAMVLKGSAPESLLDTYSDERLPAVRSVLRSTDQIATIFLAHSRISQLLRDAIVLPLLRSRAMQERMTRKLSQLTATYRSARLSVHQEGMGLPMRTRVHAGDRAPDVAFRDLRTGELTTLFAQLRNVRLIALIGADMLGTSPSRLVAAFNRLGVDCLLVLPAVAGHAISIEAVGTTRCVRDPSGEFQRLYSTHREFLYLIRPDGYVGLFQHPINERALREYLRKLFMPDAITRAFLEPESRVPAELHH